MAHPQPGRDDRRVLLPRDVPVGFQRRSPCARPARTHEPGGGRRPRAPDPDEGRGRRRVGRSGEPARGPAGRLQGPRGPHRQDPHRPALRRRDAAPLDTLSFDLLKFLEVCTKAGSRSSTREQKGLRLHDLRHSAATILLAAGVPERVVMEILDHSTTAMIKRYQHVLPGLTVAAAERMDRAMGR